MGLDQYAYFTKDADPNNCEHENFYWRKHPNLQGYMRMLWEARGNKEDFNCVYMQLSLDDMEKLLDHVKAKALPSTTGFFFGGNSDADYRDRDIQFCTQAIDHIQNGYNVFYSSSW